MNESNLDKKENYLYVTFRGPSVDTGEMDIGQASKVFTALDKWRKQYEKEFISENHLIIKLKSVEKGSTDLQFVVDILQAGSSPATVLAASKLVKEIGNFPGIKDFLQKIGDELGRQVSLKIASKGKTLTESVPYVKDSMVMVDVFNGRNKVGSIEKSSIDFYHKSNKTLNDLYILSANKITEAEVGYKVQGAARSRLATIKLIDRESFTKDESQGKLADRLVELFDKDKAEEVKIVGRFIDSYGLAHRYQFALQVKKDTGKYGKQKVLCDMPAELISPTYDLLKPENRKDVLVKGLATRDSENRLDKLKVEWYSEDLEYNPDQTSLLNHIDGEV